ncbi:MAG TPA: sensor histidine kinase [Conexibacter sp.]|nr:sensor histidine kinase [Conexibacter sp.]
MTAPSPLARMLLRRQLSDLEREHASVEQLRTRMAAERRAAGAAAIRAQEQERQRLAQDLHDEVNQALTAILLRLEATIQEAPAELQEELRDTKRLAGQAMEELLRLARRLRPAVLDDHGLMPALHTQVRDFTEQTGIRATFHPQGAPTRLSAEQQLAIYRVTQEGLSNIAQHASAQRVRVELSFVGRTVLRISDDGSGFTRRKSDRLGMEGMRERALLAGGHLSIWSEEGAGTRVELTI